MPYFKRDPIEAPPTPRRSQRRSTTESPNKAKHPTPENTQLAVANPSAVERASAILARDRSFDDDELLAATTSPQHLLASLCPSLVAPAQALAPAPAPTDPADVPLLETGGRHISGSVAVLPMTLANDDTAPVALAFRATDLLSSEGGTILSRHVNFNPTTLTLAAHAESVVEIRIAVPLGTPSGTYVALIQTLGDDDVRAVISLQVAAGPTHQRAIAPPTTFQEA